MRKPSPAMIVALLALFVALGGVGVAATGGNFILGQSNTATTNTSLSAPVAGGKALQLTNNDTSNAASTALGLNVASGHSPFTVNTGIKVANLNADKLDGIDSTGFLSKTGIAADSAKLGGQLPGYYLPKTGKAADADKLDGLDSADFLRGGYVVVTPVGQGFVLPGDGSLHVVTQLALPPGRYLVTGKAGVDVTNSTPVSRVTCYLDDSGNSGSFAGFDNTTISVSADRQGALVTTGGAEIQGGGGILMKCFATRGEATLCMSTITAIRLATLTRSTP